MAETAFSPDGKYYSALSQDGRLRIWDTETSVLKQEYTPDLHLTAPSSCLQWITVSQSAGNTQKKGKKNSSFSENEGQCIALGTTSGKILIYSVAQAKVQTVLEKGNSRITALDWHRKYGLYSCNKDSNVCEWDLQTSSVRHKYTIKVDNKGKQGNTISAIKIIPHNLGTTANYLVAASTQLRIWRLHGPTATVVRTLGHNASATALLALACHNGVYWLIEGSQNERLLSFWDVTITNEKSEPEAQVNGDDVTPSKRQRKKSLTAQVHTPTYNFVLEDAPRIVDAQLKEDDGSVKLHLAAATRSGVVHYYGHTLNGSSTKPIKPSVTVQVTTGDAKPLPLQCCRQIEDGDLMLGYNSGPLTVFEKVTPDLKTKTQVLIRGEAKPGKKGKQQSEVNKVQADVGNKDVTYVEPLAGSRKRTTPGAQIEVPMEARLENLALDVNTRGKSAVSENLTKLLMQGLHSKDNGIILTVLQKNDQKVALRSVANLPAEYVHMLLEQLTEMATKKTSQCASASTWLAAVVRRHAALLLAAPAAPRLAELLAICTHRRSHLCQLLNLKGRLDLMIKQRAAQTDEAQEEQQAILEYNDTSSDEEMEVEQYQSAGSDDGEQSWDEHDTEASADDD